MIFKQNVHTNCKMSTITNLCEYGGCDSKHDIAYILRQKEMEFISVEDVIQNTISLTP